MRQAQRGVRVSCGANTGTFPDLVGRTVGDVPRDLKKEVPIPSGAEALLRGRRVDDTHVLEAGDEVEYRREVGNTG